MDKFYNQGANGLSSASLSAFSFSAASGLMRRDDAQSQGNPMTTDRSEGFPERDIWFLGTLEQGSARCPEFLGNRRRRRRRQDLMDIEVQ